MAYDAYGDWYDDSYDSDPGNYGPQDNSAPQNYWAPSAPASTQIQVGSGGGYTPNYGQDYGDGFQYGQPTAQPQYQTQARSQPGGMVYDTQDSRQAARRASADAEFNRQMAQMASWNTAPSGGNPSGGSSRPTGNTYTRDTTTPEQRLATVANSSAGATNNASAPTYFLQRLKSLMENPGQITSDPAYQFLQDQGMNALNRTAGAKRMRFAGKTQLEAQKFGQGLAATQYQNLVNQAMSGATNEANRWQNESNVGRADMAFNSGRSDIAGAEQGSAQALQEFRRLLERYAA